MTDLASPLGTPPRVAAVGAMAPLTSHGHDPLRRVGGINDSPHVVRPVAHLGRNQVSHQARQALVHGLPPRSIFHGSPSAFRPPTESSALAAGMKVV